jgi:three-Cys-motif partner protein
VPLIVLEAAAKKWRNTEMARTPKLRIDEVGQWSELKLEILKKYAAAYSRILSSKGLHHYYIDAFAGAGRHLSKQSGELIPGSPLNALAVEPPFEHFHLIDLDAARVEELRRLTAGRQNVTVHGGDSNEILLRQVLPQIRYEDYRRALCILDPYGLHLRWEVVAQAAALSTIELFVNFPVMDMNMNVLWKNDEAKREQIERMNAFWGDTSWRQSAYDSTGNLFEIPEKQSNEAVAEAYRERLKRVAGFKYVPEPAPMRNSRGAVVYYLFFAAQQPAADKIITDIFEAYKKQGRIRG